MGVLLKFLLLLIFTAFNTNAKEIDFKAEAIFKAATNVPGVSVEGRSKEFRTLKAEFSEDLLSLQKLDAELDAQTLKTGIDLRDQHMFEKVFLVLSAKEKPVHLKMHLEKPLCQKDKGGIKCTGLADFVFGKKSFQKNIEFKLDDKQNSNVVFNVSLKELQIDIPSYLGIELEDQVNIEVKASRK